MADPDPILYRQRALAINSVSTTLNAAGHWIALEDCEAVVNAVLGAFQTEEAAHHRFTPEDAQRFAESCSDGECTHARHAQEKDKLSRRYWHGITDALEHLTDASNYDKGINPDDIETVRGILRDSLDDGSFTPAKREQSC